MLRMLGSHRGIKGIARYYAFTKMTWRLKEERIIIERAIREMEGEVEKGCWLYALALYQFCGSLSETGKCLPWGDNRGLSAKWLEIVYYDKGGEVLRNVVKNEAARLGHSSVARRMLSEGKVYYPHTPDGWKPGK